jgi:hypothetical protein
LKRFSTVAVQLQQILYASHILNTGFGGIHGKSDPSLPDYGGHWRFSRAFARAAAKEGLCPSDSEACNDCIRGRANPSQ